jgi:Leucine-rich repeat (LRR) protein
MLRDLDLLPKSYRLNVMDLGGSMGILKKGHLANFCKIRTLKYLSLRNTDVRSLPSQLQELRLLETLDIRHTNIPHGSRNSQALLPPSLKHLLAGNVDSQGDAPNATVRMPNSIQEMPCLEVRNRTFYYIPSS